MVRREPLTNIQNDSSLGRKVQKTYGKRGKVASLNAAKDIFTASTERIVSDNEIERSLAALTISEDDVVENAACVERVPRKPTETPRTTTAAGAPPATRSTAPPQRHRHHSNHDRSSDSTHTEKASLSLSQPPSNYSTDTGTSPSDKDIITTLAAQYSDRRPLPFVAYGTKVSKSYNVSKIGEGAYSSVFALTRRDATPIACPSSSTNSSHLDASSASTITILKLMPILLPSTTAQPGQTLPAHIANELRTMHLMDSVHGFIRYRGLTIVHGPWPDSFLSAFRAFRATHPKKAENEDPESAYGHGQYYALVEMDDAGREVSDVFERRRPSIFQIWDLVWQTVVFLAAAEGQCGFEHRDLHVSNLCVRPGPEERMDVTEGVVQSMHERPESLLGTSGIGVTLIDYTFSRAVLAEGKGVLFREFEPEGDGYDALLKRWKKDAKKIGTSGEKFEERLQQLTYAKVARCMELSRQDTETDACPRDEETEQTGRQPAAWAHFVPRSNVCWLGYLIACLLGRAGKTTKTKYVNGSNEAARKVQDEMRKMAGQLKDLLLDEHIEALPKSADDLLRIGIQRGWLSRHEIDAFKSKLEEDS